ncbi:MAG TPA: aldehyde dehydrogenase family protein [Streptosporangiaceae bacterium]|nr:aldehyde dehydrogenase family protein [Streptosporangiaceae bacterium]
MTMSSVPHEEMPWNFPFDLSVGPLVEMLAAGNRVIIKPSDYTPACGELLRAMVADTFAEDQVAVCVGGLTLAKEFPTLRWDHLLYTGSPAVGREVARAAAENLVPVTLEATRRPATAPASSPSGTGTGSPRWSTRPGTPAPGSSPWAGTATTRPAGCR